MADWSAHLTTLFPEVRLKQYIELRGADSQAPELMLAVPALAKGIFYEADCLLAAWDLVKAWSWEERMELYHAVHRQALQARIRRIGLAELARELVASPSRACSGKRALDARGDDESIYLDGSSELVQRGGARPTPSSRSGSASGSTSRAADRRQLVPDRRVTRGCSARR